MRPCAFLGAGLGLLALSALSGMGAPTSITLDGSFGHAAGTLSPTSPGFYQVTPAMGFSAGSNLFQSFSTFNIGTGDTVDFTANAGTQNIIARVTGGSASSIDGTIESGAPNFFLLNPAGVMFGANAQVNLTGAFTVSTANYVKLSDGSIFYADTQHPINDAGLTTAPISAFGFLQATPAPVSFAATHLTNAGGLHVITGNITLDQAAVLAAPGGNLTLFSAASAGELPVTPGSPGGGFASATNTAFGNIAMDGGSALAIDSAQGGGAVVIRGGRIIMQGSNITSNNTGAAGGGTINVTGGDISLNGGSVILATAQSAGSSGHVTLQAQSLTLDGVGTAVASESQGSATGNSDGVAVTVTGAMSITSGAEIAADTFSAGRAGEISVTAGLLTIDGSGSLAHFTGLSSTSATGATASVGGGVMLVDVSGALTLHDGGTITANTLTPANAGAVSITADSMTIDGGGLTVFTGVFDESGLGSHGNGGNVIVNVTKTLSVVDGGSIDTDTDSSGNGGKVTVNAGAVMVDGMGAPDFTGISSQSEQGATGNAGQVTVLAAGDVSILDLGGIEASTFSSGTGGTIILHADSLFIDGTADPNALTGISSDSGQYGLADVATGAGGSVHIDLKEQLVTTGEGASIEANAFSLGPGGSIGIIAGQSVAIDSGSSVTSDTYMSGAGGTVTVTAPAVVVDGAESGITANSVGSLSPTASGNGGAVVINASEGLVVLADGQVSAQSTAQGNGGAVRINAGTVAVDSGGQISAASANTSAGTVRVRGGSVSLNNGAILTSAKTFGGNIDLELSNLFYSIDGEISASAVGSGGNITIEHPQFVVLDESPITASGGVSNGNIEISPEFFLTQSSPVTATGIVTITTPDLNLSNSLLPLPDVLVSDDNRLKESCARSVKHEFSSLVVVGRGGMEQAPDELQPDFGVK